MPLFNSWFPTSIYGSDTLNVKNFGAIGDGASHPLSSVYGSLAEAQVVYSFATSLTQELDYCACKATSNAALGGDLEVLTSYVLISETSDGLYIIDDTQNWVVNEHAGRTAFCKFGNDFVDSVPILSNTSTVITLASPMGFEGFTEPHHLYAIGYGEHGNNSDINKPIYIPAGTYQFGDDTWLIRNLKSGRIFGDSRLATVICGNQTVLAFDGIWYSRLHDFSLVCNTDDGIAALDLDGNVPDHPYATRGVQAVTLQDMLFDGGGGPYAMVVCRQGGGGGQGSECLYLNCHFNNASEACYHQRGFNALANTFIGGNFQNYTKHGIWVYDGSFSVYNTGFQPIDNYTQLVNEGWDILVGESGAYAGNIIEGCRTEGMRFLKSGGAARTFTAGCTSNISTNPRFANTDYGTGTVYGKAVAEVASDNLYHLYVATTEGTSGSGGDPVWPLNGGTVADGTVVWTETPFESLRVESGHVDTHTTRLDIGTKTIPSELFLITVSADYTTVDFDDVVAVNCTSGAKTITLSPQTSPFQSLPGREITIKKNDISNNAVTIYSGDGFENGSQYFYLAGGRRNWVKFKYGVVGAGNSVWLVIDEGFHDDTPVIEYTDDHTLTVADNHRVIEMNKASAVNVTLPPYIDPALSLPLYLYGETKITVVQTGAGQVTFVPGAGVTIRSKSGLLSLTGQYSAASLYKRNYNEWILVGDLA